MNFNYTVLMLQGEYKELILEHLIFERVYYYFSACLAKKRKKCISYEVYIDNYIEPEEQEQTREFMVETIKKDGLLLQFAQDLRADPEIALIAIKNNINSFQYVHLDLRKNEDFMLEAIGRKGILLKYSLTKPRNLVLSAIKNDGLALEYVEEQDIEIILLAVMNNGLALRFAKYKTDEIIQLAVANNGLAIQFVDEIDKELAILTLRRFDVRMLRIIPRSLLADEDIAFEIVKQNWRMLEHLKENMKSKILLYLLQNELPVIYHKLDYVLDADIDIAEKIKYLEIFIGPPKMTNICINPDIKIHYNVF